MIESAGSRLLLAVAALAAGVLGEVFSPNLFSYGASIDGVIALQILFIGLFLFGFYIVLGLIPAFIRVKQSLRLHESLLDRIDFWATLVGGMLTVIVLLAFVFVSLPSEFPDPTVNSAITLLVVSSLLASVFLVVFTGYLRRGTDRHHHRLVKVCSVLLILIAFSWVIAQRTVYAILLATLGDLWPSHYVALAQLSSVILLGFVFLGSLYFVLYYFRPESPRTVEPTQKPEQAST